MVFGNASGAFDTRRWNYSRNRKGSPSGAPRHQTAKIDTMRATTTTTLTLLLLLGCSDSGQADDETTTSSTDSSTSAADGATSTSSSSDAGETSTDSIGDEGSFVDPDSTSSTTGEPDHTGEPCDGFNHDCPDGYKCMPTTMSTAECMPIAEDPVGEGEACMLSALFDDNCDSGLMCWFWGEEGEPGVCLPACSGNADEPTCGGSSHCLFVVPDVYGLCSPQCDPLTQDCPGNDSMCETAGGGFHCYSEGTVEEGDICDGYDCVAGNKCAPSDAVNCAGDMCCTPFCDTTDPNSCDGVATGSTCFTLYGGVEGLCVNL